MNGDRVLRIIAALTLWLAPLPAAFFVGRSVYWHLIHNWHLDLMALGIIAAVLAGGMIELVGLLSSHTALACARWNHHGNVRKEQRAWERAPFWPAASCFVVYVVVAIVLAVVLEARPDWAIYAPALITAMAATAYVSLGIYEQQRDRLARYNLEWNWKAKPNEDSELEKAKTELEKPEGELTEPEPKTEPESQFATKGDHIRYLLAYEPGLTQTELAMRSGASASYVSEVRRTVHERIRETGVWSE